MKLSLIANLVLAVACVALAACGTANTQGFADAAREIAKDPNCGHTDRLDIDLGMTGSHGKLFLERNCPMPQTGAPQTATPQPTSTTPAS